MQEVAHSELQNELQRTSQELTDLRERHSADSAAAARREADLSQDVDTARSQMAAYQEQLEESRAEAHAVALNMKVLTSLGKQRFRS